VVSAVKKQADHVFGAVSSTQGAFLRYGPMFQLIERLSLSSELVGSLQAGLRQSEVAPSVAMRRFERILGWFELRHSGLIHPVANFFLLWDAHCLLRLEGWQRAAGRHARRWFHALGEVEALSAFAGLSFDEPGFAWPEIAEGPARFEARGLGHMLLPSGFRVDNDVSLTEPGRALLVTGSNMSGKSTLLRAMGTATVMALAGAPVCARTLRISPLTLRTSLRISDSLAKGVSHFYQEVSRLKGALDATELGTPVLFLLDEILHGTNSEERQIGARWILAELLQRGAIGAVSTHDIALCRLPDALMSRVEQAHFRESVENGKMTFDYRLRPGPVTGGNALRLMRLVGLPVPLTNEA
jgi:DNA mismatch repair ATPase MutS